MKMNTCCWFLLAWMAVWMTLVVEGQVLRVPIGPPTTCLPEIPSSTTYKADDIILCTLLSEAKRANGFYYQGVVFSHHRSYGFNLLSSFLEAYIVV